MLARQVEWKQMVSVVLIGILVGLVSFGVGFLLNQFVFSPIACQAQSNFVRCVDAEAVSHNIALLLGAIAGVTLLVRAAVYRPLLAVLASVVSLWGVTASLSVSSTPWLALLVITALLTGLVYALFVWLALFRRFIVSLLVSTIVVVVLRLTLNA